MSEKITKAEARRRMFFLRPATVVLNWTGYEVVDGIVMSPAVAKAYRSWRSDDGEDDR